MLYFSEVFTLSFVFPEIKIDLQSACTDALKSQCRRGIQHREAWLAVMRIARRRGRNSPVQHSVRKIQNSTSIDTNCRKPLKLNKFYFEFFCTSDLNEKNNIHDNVNYHEWNSSNQSKIGAIKIIGHACYHLASDCLNHTPRTTDALLVAAS